MPAVIFIAIILLSGLCPAARAANPSIQIEPRQIIIRNQVRDLTAAQGFQQTSQMFVKRNAQIVPVDDEIFILRVRVRNYTREKLSLTQDGSLYDDDWVVDVPGLAVGVESAECKVTPISSAAIEPCRGSVRFDEIGPRMARDMNLVLRFTGAIQNGPLDFKVGLKVRQTEGAAEEVFWSGPVSVSIDPWPVRQFLMLWNEKEEWKNNQRKMRDEKEAGMISRYYVPGGGLRVEENYEGGQLSGVRKTYFENGVVKEEEHYRDGQLHGERWVYQKNKELILYEIYLSGECLGFARFSSFDQKRDKEEKMARVRAMVTKEYPQMKPDLKVDLVPPAQKDDQPDPVISGDIPAPEAVPQPPE